MKRFMVVCSVEGEQSAMFTDDALKAVQYKIDCECGLGGYAEVYEYHAETEEEYGGYEFLYS